ncbi:MAG: hypothetical protein ABL958_11580 [Bdellovibrionia bacterium]
MLPKSVNHPSIRFGVITGFGDKYHSNGLLSSVGENYTRTFDSATLTAAFPEARALVASLNQFGSLRLGDQLNLGTLNIEAEPKVRYEAGVFARGISKNFTLAGVFPVVHYEVNAQVNQTGGNVREILASLPADLRAQVSNLPLDLVAGFHSRMATGGYSSFGTRSETFFGDAQLLGFYRYHESAYWSGVVKTTLTLPTGPKDNPDDLLDLPFFGQTSVGVHFLQDLHPWKNLVLGAYAGHTVKVPDRIVRRVPRDEADIIPDSTRKEELVRDLGDVTTGGVNSRYLLGESFEVGLGLEFGFKAADHYSGSNGWNYGLVGKDSYSEWQKLQAGVEFSTTNSYLKKSFPIPFAIAYEYGDIISGINVERQISHEIIFKGYF